MAPVAPAAAGEVNLHLVHCSYHKCLTVYFSRVMRAVFNRCLPWSRGFHHYNSHLEDFYASFAGHRVASVNNRRLDLSRLERFRLSRFLRAPRDLVVSGYFYHRRGAEPWTTLTAPTSEDWYVVNGVVPQGLQNHGGTFAEYLRSIPEEDGLLTELEFRRGHFESMAGWSPHPDIALYRYEDILGHEAQVFHELFEFYRLSPVERTLGDWFARRYSVRTRSADAHVRDPSPGQWRKHFTPRVRAVFDAEYSTLVRQLGYPVD